MHDILYTNQGAENSGALSDTRIKDLAEHIKLDMTKFNACFGGAYRSKVLQDGQDAKAAGVNSTPSFVVNGKLVTGAQPFSVFQQEIEAALAGK
jgi:protein-disulfide isomerase